MDEAGWRIVKSTELTDPVWLQATAYMERTFILSKTVPDMLYYMYFKVIDGQRAEDWYLFDENSERPTPMAAGYGVVAHQLGFAKCRQRVDLHKEIQAWLFKKGGRTVLALWSTARENVPFSWNLPIEAQVVDFIGQKAKSHRTDCIRHGHPGSL